MIKGMTVESGKAILSFEHIGGGLKTLDDKRLRGFYISSDGENFVEAAAEIKGNTVVVLDERVKNPVAVRYGAEDDLGKEGININLGNVERMPASPFTIVVNN